MISPNWQYMCRYMNHIQSLKFENKLYAVVKEKMEEMQLQSMSWIEVMFLLSAVCRSNTVKHVTIVR